MQVHQHEEFITEGLILDPYIALARLEPQISSYAQVLKFKLQRLVPAQVSSSGVASGVVRVSRIVDTANSDPPRRSKRLRGFPPEHESTSGEGERSVRRARVSGSTNQRL
jgi:hypothetical protein